MGLCRFCSNGNSTTLSILLCLVIPNFVRYSFSESKRGRVKEPIHCSRRTSLQFLQSLRRTASCSPKWSKLYSEPTLPVHSARRSNLPQQRCTHLSEHLREATHSHSLMELSQAIFSRPLEVLVLKLLFLGGGHAEAHQGMH